MMLKMDAQKGAGGSEGVVEMSFINGNSSSVYIQNYNDTTNQTDTPTATYKWTGNYIINDFTTNPRTFKAAAACRATVLNPDGTRTTGSFKAGDTMLSWTQSGLSGSKPFQCGVVVF